MSTEPQPSDDDAAETEPIDDGQPTALATYTIDLADLPPKARLSLALLSHQLPRAAEQAVGTYLARYLLGEFDA